MKLPYVSLTRAADAIPTGIAWYQVASPIIAVVLAAVVPIALHARTRRDRRKEAASAEQRKASAALHDLIIAADIDSATSYDGPASGCDGPVSNYDEWLNQWKRRTQMLLPRLSRAERERVELLTHLLERSSKLGQPSDWWVAIRYAVADAESALSPTLTGKALLPPMLPTKNRVDDLMAQGTALKTSDAPLVDAIHQRFKETMRAAARSEFQQTHRRGLILGICLTVLAADCAYVVSWLVF